MASKRLSLLSSINKNKVTYFKKYSCEIAIKFFLYFNFMNFKYILIYFSLSLSPMAVSYTHLDVYKRQM